VALEHSRSLLLAAAAAGTSPSALERRLEDSTVVVSVDPGLPHGLLAARVLLTTLRRGPGRLALERDGLPGREAERIEAAVNAVDGSRPLRVGCLVDDDRAVRIHVGASGPRGVIRIVPEGHGAHVAAASSAVISSARAGNALGAVYNRCPRRHRGLQAHSGHPPRPARPPPPPEILPGHAERRSRPRP
jgi:hypothetical protein